MNGLSTIIAEGSPPVLHVRGELDMATADALRFALKRALTDDPAVLIDMSDVTFVDVAGVRVILEAAARRNGDGPLRLIHAERVAWLLELIGLDEQTVSVHFTDRGGQDGR